MKKQWDVLGMGAVAVDDILLVEQYPAVDTKTPVLARERQAGGLAGTALVTVARLGGSSTYLGVLGQDELSSFTLMEFEREGVDCSLVGSDPSARPIHSTVIVEKKSGMRTIFFDISGFQPPGKNLLSEEILLQCRVLFVDYTVPEAATWAGRKAGAMGIPVIADIERGTAEDLKSMLSVVDHLVIGIQMGRQLCGKMDPQEVVAEMLKQNFTAVVVTSGDQGCWYAEHGEAIAHQPALEVEVVDTVGCGDVFHGAYAFSIARGYDIRQAVKIANVTAGLKARKPGGRRGIPGWNEVLTHL